MQLKSSIIGITYDNNSSFLREKRSLGIEYPTKPLENNVPEAFEVTKSKRKGCGLFSGSTDTVTSYKVLKIDTEFGEEYTNFYVVPGSTGFTRTQDPEAEEFHIQKRYDEQIAFAVCQPGWIEKVWVNSGKENEDTDVRINARKC